MRYQKKLHRRENNHIASEISEEATLMRVSEISEEATLMRASEISEEATLYSNYLHFTAESRRTRILGYNMGERVTTTTT